jgi:hypothetical protein
VCVDSTAAVRQDRDAARAACSYVNNDDGQFRDKAGNPMPPCIVIERGEGLRDRSKMAAADRAGTAQVHLHSLCSSAPVAMPLSLPLPCSDMYPA